MSCMGQFKTDLARAGLSVEEFDVLVHLAWARDETLMLQELTSSMVLSASLTRSGITRLLDRMERDGLVRRTLSHEDRRRFDVSLTAKGRRTFAQLGQVLMRASWWGRAWIVGDLPRSADAQRGTQIRTRTSEKGRSLASSWVKPPRRWSAPSFPT
jgi:DNA-binding MarR family transcriptional regulator